ncbi:MAG: Xaa-Pro peptidase family protein [Syntrophomonadaceae bacterium]
MFKQRLYRLRQVLEAHELGAFLVTKPENIYYLSGFTGGSDARLVVGPVDRYIVTDGRYLEQVGRECPDWELVQDQGGGLDSLAAICDKYNSLAVESNHVTYGMFVRLQSTLKANLSPQDNIIEGLRRIKDAAELDRLRSAAKVGDEVFKRICLEITPGWSEIQVANRIAGYLKELGCSREAFPTIAVAGENAALPHGQPGGRRLQNGDMLTMDFGGFCQGYAGDMTRTVAIGEVSPRLREVYSRVLEAQQRGVASITAGIRAQAVDQLVRNELARHGLDEYFLHGTGHGVGLEIHEAPSLSRYSEDVLEENMVVTVEPGVYIPGWGGIRIEDTVVVQYGGCEVITASEKELLIL